VVFDPDGDGAYLAWGPYYAARQTIHHIHTDFSRPPEAVLPAVPLDAVVVAVAQVENRVISQREKLQAFVELAAQHPDDANLSFLIARKSFHLREPDRLAEFAERAYVLDPRVIEYRLYAGLAAYRQGQPERAITLLEPIPESRLFPEQALYRLWVLENAWAAQAPVAAAACAERRQAILTTHNAHAYYESAILPKLQALDNDRR
jgi:hypothetical protein